MFLIKTLQVAIQMSIWQYLTFAAPLNDFDVFFKKSLKKPSGKAKKKCL